MRNRTLWAVLAVLLLAPPAAAQESNPMGTRIINSASPFPVGHHRLEFLVTHRFHEAINDGTSHDLWGLDSGADTGIGFTYGVAPRLDLSLYRVSFQEDFELAGKFMILQQEAGTPLTLTARAGADLLRRPGVPDSSRPFAQLLLSREIRPGWILVASPSWVADTPSLENAFNVPLGLTIPLPGDQYVELEYVPANRDLDASRAAWHVALSKTIGGHLFEIVLGNSRATTVDQILGGDSAAGFESRDVRLGFNLIRLFGY